MYNTLSLLLICSLNSPHHMGPRNMGMGMGPGNSFQDTNSFYNLSPGSYYFTFIDANGCTYNQCFDIQFRPCDVNLSVFDSSLDIDAAINSLG